MALLASSGNIYVMAVAAEDHPDPPAEEDTF
jgi:hypothetical protein